MKRIFDFILALVGLVISFPLWIIFGLAIWLEDRGPIFYFQERVGKDGRIFQGIKFRSMLVGAEKGVGPVQAREHDRRVTKVGKILRVTAMDELPQLWNIFKGQMSFVGPRALRPVEIDSPDQKPKSVWEFAGFKERCRVRPGLTGIAQILAPRDITRTEKFKYDIWYVKHQNFWLDIKIIIVSFLITFLGRWETRKERFKTLSKRFHSQIIKEIT
jgi:lipopolysaccharide/colanic/teichoic acid biosynthesis glycosyltransferase